MVEVASLSSAYRTRRISTVGVGEGHAQLRNQHLPSFGGRKRGTEAKGNLGYRTQGQHLCESEQKPPMPTHGSLYIQFQGVQGSASERSG